MRAVAAMRARTFTWRPESDDAPADLATRDAELARLLETGAYLAQKWYGGKFLIVDRVSEPLTADIKMCLPERLVDLWDINPILWDDMHWAAIRLITPGTSTVVQPHLHAD